MTEKVLSNGNLLMDLKMPEKTLAIMVKRGDHYFVPTGKTQLHIGDRLMIITDNDEALQQTLTELGIQDEPKKEEKNTIIESIQYARRRKSQP